MKRLPKASLAAMAACVLVLGACGDDDDAPSDDTSEDTESEDTESEDTESEDTESEDTESEDTESEDTESEDTSEGLPGGDPEEIATDMFVNMGMTEEQATCLVDKMDIGNIESAEDIDVTQIMDYIEDCDIDMADLTPGG